MKNTSLERFAQEARVQLQNQIKARLSIVLQNKALYAVENYTSLLQLEKKLNEVGETTLIEEVAYTWFNRITALRFMDANYYNRTMIISPVEGSTLPEILSNALTGVIDDSIDNQTKQIIEGLINGSIKSNNPQRDIYRLLLVGSCNDLNKKLPFLFETISDYTDLLLPEDLLSSDSVISKTVKALSKDNCESVEVLGWLYQFYISEKKDEVFANFKKGKKAGSKEIPAATQLFTPEWIVRYLVENSLGRLWMLNFPNSSLRSSMKYYIEPSESEKDFIHITSPEDLTILDPCCGSGHMLVYAFDLLMEMYLENGYSDTDAVEAILKKNIYGIEIDKRAGQLAFFALMMKARERSKRFLNKGITPNICVLENVKFDEDEKDQVVNCFEIKKLNNITKDQIRYFIEQFEQADILGSLINPIISDISALRQSLKKEENSLFSNDYTDQLNSIFNQAEYLSKKYDVVVTNPPYMDPAKCDPLLGKFAVKCYPNSKPDMGTIFIERNFKFISLNGYVAMITLQSWMFLGSFEKLRKEILENRTILSMAHIGARGFDSIGGEVVSTTAYVLKGLKEEIKGQYFRLIDGTSENSKSEMMVKALNHHNKSICFEIDASNFKNLPGMPIVYWASEAIFRVVAKTAAIARRSKPLVGLQTAGNGRFLRFWYEIYRNKLFINCLSKKEALRSKQKWFPHNKGGAFRKWYGNLNFVINWENDGQEIRSFKGAVIRNPDYYFKKGITWTDVSTNSFASRIIDCGAIFDTTGPTMFSNDTQEIWLNYVLGYSNSIVFDCFTKLFCTGLHFSNGVIAHLPCDFNETWLPKVDGIVQEQISISKTDWDSFETSWDFERHPMVVDSCSDVSLSDLYAAYKTRVNEAFFKLKANEEELNRIFIEIYGLSDELEAEESDSMVSVHRIFDTKDEIPECMRKGQYALTKEDVVKSLISYFVGCIFGRYDVIKEGLIYAGGEFDKMAYSIQPDEDNVVPILGDSWFNDDAANTITNIIKKQYGSTKFYENINFIEDALGKSIRDYLYKDFYKDHLRTYQKRPIYWMFSSPKGHFQALVYLHRYNQNTANNVLKYLREFQIKIKAAIVAAEEAGDTKEVIKYQNIAKDLDDYENNTLFPLATQHLTFDLDDGVVVNYDKLGKALKPIK